MEKHVTQLSPQNELQHRIATNGAGIPGDITLGEYVNQDWPKNGAYIDMANHFLSGLTYWDSIFGEGPGKVPGYVRARPRHPVLHGNSLPLQYLGGAGSILAAAKQPGRLRILNRRVQELSSLGPHVCSTAHCVRFINRL